MAVHVRFFEGATRPGHNALGKLIEGAGGVGLTVHALANPDSVDIPATAAHYEFSAPDEDVYISLGISTYNGLTGAAGKRLFLNTGGVLRQEISPGFQGGKLFYSATS